MVEASENTEEARIPFDDLFQALKTFFRFGPRPDFKRLHEQFVLLDEAPRHDCMLDDATYARVYKCALTPYPRAFADAISDLKQICNLLQRTQDKIEGVFRSELKVRLEDALGHQSRDLKHLLETFESSRAEHSFPRQPYKIRQQSLSGILLSLNSLISEVKEIRRSANKDLLGDIYTRLLDAENRLYQLRAKLSRCRDNPSQRMSLVAKSWLNEFVAINEQLQSVKSKCKYEFLRHGGRYRGRSGELTAQWVPAMADADPWTFDSEPYMLAYRQTLHA